MDNVLIEIVESPDEVTINIEPTIDEVSIDIIEGGGGGIPLWGDILGLLSDQTDLQLALDGKEDLIGFTPANELISITGTGLLSGQGGNLTTNRVFSLENSDIDHSSLDAASLMNDDHTQYLLVNGSRAMTGNLDLGNNDLVNPGAGHDDFTDFVLNEHIDHSTVSILGAGLLAGQGGDITTSRVFTLTNSNIDHGLLDAASLLDDDHTQYFLANGSRAMSGNIVMGDNSITGIDNLIFTDVNGQIAGIENQNLLDKTAIETITGLWNWTDNIRSLNFDTTSGTRNIHIGDFNLSSGSDNLIITKSTASPTISGSNNVAMGSFALDSAIAAEYNVAIGANALKSLTNSDNCVAIGAGALETLATAGDNLAIGTDAGKNITADKNVAIGALALKDGGAGQFRIAIGSNSAEFCTGNNNIAIGSNVLRGSSSHASSENISIGGDSLNFTTGSYRNVVIGARALQYSSVCSDNVVIGSATALFLTTGSRNVIIGRTAGLNVTSGSGNVIIGYGSAVNSITTESNILWIENTSTTTPLVYGEFNNRLIQFHADVLTLSPSTVDTDAVVNFVGTTNSGILTWMEDEDYFKFSDDILMDASEKINLRDTAIGIYSQADTFLDLFADGSVRIGDSSGGTPSNYVEIESDGDLFFVGGAGIPFGSLYIHEGTQNIDISSVGQGVYVKITGFTTGELHNVTINSDAFNVGKIGKYKIDWQMSGDSAGNNKDYEVDIFVNDVEQNDGSSRRQFGAIGSLGSMSGTGIIDITNTGHDIDLRVKEIGAGVGTDFDVFNMNFNIMQIGG